MVDSGAAGGARRSARHRAGADRGAVDLGVERGPEPTGSAPSASATPTTSAPPPTSPASSAEAGCVAFLSTNASPAMAPWGGRTKAVGTNPWSIAAPAGRRGVVVMDIANTAVARGKIYLAAERGGRHPGRLGRRRRRHSDHRCRQGGARTDPADGGPQGLRHLLHDGRAGRGADRQQLRQHEVAGPYEPTGSAAAVTC